MKVNVRNLNLSLIITFALLVISQSESYAAEQKHPSEIVDFSDLKIDKTEINKSLTESKKVTDYFLASRRKAQGMDDLTPAQKAALQKRVDQIKATKKAIKLSGSKDIIVDDQSPGNSVIIKSVTMEFKGFIAIEYLGNVIGTSPLLPIGTTQNITIPLTEHVDGVTLLAYFYKDNGDGIFNKSQDEYSDPQRGRVFREFDITTKRDLQNAYYSNYLAPNEIALILREQPAGNKVEYIDGVLGVKVPKNNNEPVIKTKPYFVAIFKDKNGFPGKFIGNSPLKKSYRVNLIESVSNEMLYAMLFQDNGDKKFDLMSDPIIRGEDGLIIIVKFKVVQ